MTHYRRIKTQPVSAKDPIAEHHKRIYLCVEACKGIDNSMLNLLAKQNNEGQTMLQEILSRISWTNIPCPTAEE